MNILEEKLFSFGDFRVDALNSVLRHNGEIIPLPLKSVELLTLLVENRGKIVSKAEIFERVWKDSFVEDSVLTNNIYKLRKTFEDFDEKGLIKTVPRRGYVFHFEEKHELNLIIERDLYEQIEITETLPENQTLTLPSAPPQKRASVMPMLAVCSSILLITVGVFAFWSWNDSANNSKKSEIRSFAVLPVRSFNPNADDEQLRLQITDSLITKFGNLKDVSVRPTSAVIEYIKSEKTAVEIGKELRVQIVLAGSCQIEGENLRVNFQLISVNDGTQIWAEQFTGKINQFLKFQDEISAKLLPKVSLRLSVNELAIFNKRPTENIDAYQNYLYGRYFWKTKNLDRGEKLATARKFFEKAIELDPNFALAYANLSTVVSMQSTSEYIPRKEGLELTKMLAVKAYELDPNLAETNAALGFTMQIEPDQTNSEKLLLRAIELNPNYTTSYQWLSFIYLNRGEYQKEIEILAAGRRIDPTNYSLIYEQLVGYQAANQCDKSLELLPEAITLEGDAVGKSNVEAVTYSVCGKNEQALPILERIWKEDNSKNPGYSLLSQLGYSNAKIGNREKALEFAKMIEDKKGGELYEKVIPIYLALREIEKVYRLLEEMAVKAPHRWRRLDHDLRNISLRSDPRFIRLDNKLNPK